MPFKVSGDLLCWIWTGLTDAEGTPVVRTRTSQTTARRREWEKENGLVPEGKVLTALCGEKLCVRPHHHYPVSPIELRIRQGRTVLNLDLARRALVMRKERVPQREVARILDVSARTIGRIEKGQHWSVRDAVRRAQQT